MKFDFTITISIIVLIASIISPVIVTIINNHHQYRMRKLETNSAKIALEEFIDSAAQERTISGNKFRTLSSFNKLFLYFNNISSEDYKIITNSRDYNDYNKNMTNFINKLKRKI